MHNRRIDRHVQRRRLSVELLVRLVFHVASVRMDTSVSVGHVRHRVPAVQSHRTPPDAVAHWSTCTAVGAITLTNVTKEFSLPNGVNLRVLENVSFEAPDR